MTTVLFLSTKHPDACHIAEGLARAKAGPSVTIFSATEGPETTPAPVTVSVMAEAGFDVSNQRTRSLADVTLQDVDIVVKLSADAALPKSPVLPGQPTEIAWNVIPPAVESGEVVPDETMLRQCRNEIAGSVNAFFDHGYLDAVVSARDMSRAILDQLSEGIIAHDAGRRLTCFNRAAEEITGFTRNDVLGRDCHELFTGGLCKGHCAFPGEGALAGAGGSHAVELVTRTGETRQIEMTLRQMVDDDGIVAGAIASLRDFTREHDMARRLGEIQQFSGIIGRDEKMLAVFDLIRSVADSDVPVLIQGESGTGKELVAAAVHNESHRAEQLFVPVNCGALPESLLESELFGHVRGAFTGAIRDKKGRFELADGGTIFLDDIGDVSPAVQVKLLRVLQEGTFERVGSSETVKVRVRVISATNKDLQQEIAAGRFREDLYYRLCVVPITMPPLRDRRGDIPLLVDEVLRRYVPKERGQVRLSPVAMDAMLSYDWPGNVRELQNAIQYGLVKCRGPAIELHDLPPSVPGGSPLPGRPQRQHRRRKLDPDSVRKALAETKGNKAEAARRLNVGRATLYRFLDLVGDLGV